jgi:hypothetical protein
MIRTIEELSMNAWPALQTVLYDGWVLRFANGYTRRANSVYPLYPSSLNVEGKIQVCEKSYSDRGLRVAFKMTPESLPRELDSLLNARGYQVDAYTSVQLADLGNWQETPSPDVELNGAITPEWFSAFCRMSAIDGTRKATLQRLLPSIVPNKCFASIKAKGEVIACGMGVAQDGFVGLFDIVTDVEYRQRGYGKQVVQSLLAWGKRQGAHTGYLQVMLNNTPAVSLYAKLGFREAYQYWYRFKA